MPAGSTRQSAEPQGSGLEAILCEVPGAPDWLVELADEMVEDPRCRGVVIGADGAGAVLFSLWDADAAPEVSEGLSGDVRASVRRLAVLDGQAVWG